MVRKNGESYLDTDEGKQELAIAQMWGDKTMTYTCNGVKYVYTLATGTVSLYQEPGCTTIFDISLSNGSKHTYVYKDNSLTVATPDVSNTDKTGVTGFDGQELPKEYAGNTNLELKYDKNAASGCMEDLVDAALKEYGGNHDQNQFLDSEGNLTTQSTKTNVPAGTEVELFGGKYYVKSGDHYYGGFSKSDVQTTEDGKTVLINDKNTYTLAYKKTKNGKNVEKDYYNGPFTHSSSALMNQDIQDALEQYMPAKGYKTYDDYILDYYRKPDGSKYDRVSDLLKNDPKALKELSRSGSSMPNDPNGNNTVKMDPSTLYDNFYKNVLSFKVGNQDTVDSEAGGNVDHNHSHGQWAADGTQETIGDDEGEGQTSFYLWKYETNKKTGKKDTMYCTYVEPTYTTNKDGEQVLEKDGFYCWVKYDPSKDKLTYTVTTTNGKLNIDYALLENVVYYLQEAIAPDGYDIDPEIYVICDEESYKELEGTEVTNPATGATSKVTESSWLGSILGGKTLSINFMNTATVVPDPDPEPTPDPDPVPPVDPDIPVDPANPDNPPVKDADPDETSVTPENPQNPAVQDAAPDAAALPQTGTTSWMAGVLASLGSLLLACGWFFTRKQVSPKH